jgi:hypothetical protein
VRFTYSAKKDGGQEETSPPDLPAWHYTIEPMGPRRGGGRPSTMRVRPDRRRDVTMTNDGGWPVCPSDGFPIITIEGESVCSVEYVDAIVGGQVVVDARTVDGYLYLVCENGASLPLTCPCCGGTLHLRGMTLESLTRMLSGRRLEGFRHGVWVERGASGGRHPVFALQFSGEEDPAARTVQVHLESVRRVINHAASDTGRANQSQ